MDKNRLSFVVDAYDEIDTQTWKLILDEFPAGDTIEIPLPPLASVTHVKYYDANGAQQTYSSANYHVATACEPGRIVLASGSSWPTLQTGRPEAVEIQFVAGASTCASVPKSAKAAIHVIVADRHENRDGGERSIPPAARRLLDTIEFGKIC